MLAEVNDTQIYLQQRFSRDQYVKNIKELALFCAKRRDSLVTGATERAMQIYVKKIYISMERRIGRREKKMKKSSDFGLSLIQETCREQLEILDMLEAQIKMRIQMNTINELFDFLHIQLLLNTE